MIQMKRSKLFYFIIFLVFFSIGGASFYFFADTIKTFFTPRASNTPGGAISRTEPIVTCRAGDKACATKNEKIKANRLDGAAAKFVMHQCSGPHACPTPGEEDANTIISAIRSYTKEPNLELIRVTGITPIGMIYYCAEDERCWSYDTKSKKVVMLESTDESTTSSDSAKKN